MNNTLNDGSDLEGDSQATQLLEGVLDRGVDPFLKPTHAQDRTQEHENLTRKNVSSGLSPTEPSIPPVYHFHGLAATQTQIYEHEEPEENTGSQKENIDASPKGLNEEGVRESSTRATHKGQSAQVFSRVTKVSSKAVSFDSPRGKPVINQLKVGKTTNARAPTRSTTYPVTRAPTDTYVDLAGSSQDSFAGDFQNPEQQFLAVAEQFEVPLSELRRGVVSSGGSGGHTSPGYITDTMASYSRQNRGSYSPDGRVLVAATPSNSVGSQSQQIEDESQMTPSFGRQPDYQDMVTDGFDDASQQSQGSEISIPSSSYQRFLNGEREEEPARMFQATQLSTQPSTQLDADTLEHDVRYKSHGSDSGPVAGSSNVYSNMHNHSTAPSTLPQSRNLLSLVNPKNKWRYQQYENKVPGLPSQRGQIMASLTPSVDTGNVMNDTQPSFDDEPSMKPMKRQFPKPPGFSKLAPKLSSRDGTPDDSMDIVPDSEPLRGEPATTPPVPSPELARGIGRSPIKGASRRINTSHNPDTNVKGGSSYSMDTDEPENKIADNDIKNHPRDNRPLDKEEDDDDDDDIPLAMATSRFNQKVITKGRDKGKGRQVSEIPSDIDKGKQRTSDHGAEMYTAKGGVVEEQSRSTTSLSSLTPEPPTKGHKLRQMVSAVKQTGVGHSWETGIVPSSVPEQDLVNGRHLREKPHGRGGAGRGRGRGRGGGRGSATARLNTRQKATPSRQQDNIPEEVEPPEHGVKPLIRRANEKGKEGDDETELADDDYVEIEPTRKRKRAAPPAKATNTKTNTKVPSKAATLPTTTPTTRQAKRLRSAASTSRGGRSESTRVFALWKQDGHFYSGTIYSHEEGPKYLVEFDDDTQSVVTIDQMRFCELRVGDVVMYTSHKRIWKVIDVAKFKSNGLVSICLNDDEEFEEAHVSELKIANKTITYAWKDRTISPESIITVINPTKLKSSPTPSKLSVLSTQSGRGSRLNFLAKTGLVVTLTAGNNNREEDKGKVIRDVKSSGGVIIEDWANLVRMEGKHSHTNNRWVIGKNDVKWIGKDDIERVFLLADDANQKAKFLIALALGIPCLSVSWLHESVLHGEEKDWLAYMLPQGYSEFLGARSSQQVDMDWGNSIHHLSGIMENAVPCKLFNNQSILCIGPELVPQPKGKKLPGTDEKMQEAHNAVVRIILCMGARRVEAVNDLRYASTLPSKFDLVVIREANQYSPELNGVDTVPWQWVKDSLVASRRLSLPDWSTTLK